MENEEINFRMEELRREFRKLTEAAWPCRVARETVLQYAKELDRLNSLKSGVVAH